MKPLDYDIEALYLDRQGRELEGWASEFLRSQEPFQGGRASGKAGATGDFSQQELTGPYSPLVESPDGGLRPADIVVQDVQDATTGKTETRMLGETGGGEVNPSLEETNLFGGRTAANLAAGALNVASGTMGGMEWLANALGFQDAANMAHSMAVTIEGAARHLSPAQPDFVDQLTQGFGSTIPFWGLGLGVGTGAKALAAVSNRLATTLGVGSMATAESLVEAGSVYLQAIERGESPEQANDRALMTFAANLPLNFLTDKLGIFGEGRGWQRFMSGALSEGTQEGAQEAISTLALGDPLQASKIGKAALVGALVGGPIAAVTGEMEASQRLRMPNGETRLWATFRNQGIVDDETFEVGRRLLERGLETDDFITVIQAVDAVELATDDTLRASGIVPDGEAYAVVGRHQILNDMGDSLITLFKGHDPETLVHEWYHRIWAHMDDAAKAPFVEWGKKQGFPNIEEAFADLGGKFFTQTRLDLEMERGLQAVVDRAHLGLLRFMGRARHSLGPLPAEVEALYRKSVLKGVRSASRPMDTTNITHAMQYMLKDAGELTDEEIAAEPKQIAPLFYSTLSRFLRAKWTKKGKMQPGREPAQVLIKNLRAWNRNLPHQSWLWEAQPLMSWLESRETAGKGKVSREELLAFLDEAAQQRFTIDVLGARRKDELAPAEVLPPLPDLGVPGAREQYRIDRQDGLTTPVRAIHTVNTPAGTLRVETIVDGTGKPIRWDVLKEDPAGSMYLKTFDSLEDLQKTLTDDKAVRELAELEGAPTDEKTIRREAENRVIEERAKEIVLERDDIDDDVNTARIDFITGLTDPAPHRAGPPESIGSYYVVSPSAVEAMYGGGAFRIKINGEDVDSEYVLMKTEAGPATLQDILEEDKDITSDTIYLLKEIDSPSPESFENGRAPDGYSPDDMMLLSEGDEVTIEYLDGERIRQEVFDWAMDVARDFATDEVREGRLDDEIEDAINDLRREGHFRPSLPSPEFSAPEVRWEYYAGRPLKEPGAIPSTYREIVFRWNPAPAAPPSGATAEEAAAAESWGGYRTSHWEDVPNVVFHLRFTQRLENGKRVMFIEEIQSDWHQAGRKRGYEGVDGGEVPMAPYINTQDWALAAFKVASRWAAANGMDAIGWTRGAVQVERWQDALRARVSRIVWQQMGQGVLIRPYTVSGMEAQGFVVPLEGEGKLPNRQEGSLDDVLGKSMAEEIRQQVKAGKDQGEFSGDLTIGGGGFEGFYDKILPKTIGKYVKKSWGGKVEVKEYQRPGVEKSRQTEKYWHVDLPPAARDQALYVGQAQFQVKRLPLDKEAEVAQERMATLRKIMGDPETSLISPMDWAKGNRFFEHEWGTLAEGVVWDKKTMGRGRAKVPVKVPAKAFNINFAHLRDQHDLQYLMAKVAEEYSTEIDEARRGSIGYEQQQALADDLGMTVEELLARRKGEAFNAEQALAARNILLASAEEMVRLAREVKTRNTPEARYVFQRQLALHRAIQAQVSGMTAEIGRALGSFNINIAGGDMAKIKAMQDVLEAYDMGNYGSEELATMMLHLDSAGKVAKFARESAKATTWDVLYEIWINCLLSNPVTHVVNTLSNALVSAVTIPERLLAAEFARIGSMVSGSTQSVHEGEVTAMTMGMMRGALDGFQLVWQSLKGEDVEAYHDPTTKIEARKYRAISADTFSLPSPLQRGQLEANMDMSMLEMLGLGIDLMGMSVRLPTRALQVGDAFFKSVNYRMQLHALAFRQARQETSDPHEMAVRMTEIINNPPDIIHLEAKEWAEENTFTNRLKGISQQVQRAVNWEFGPLKMPLLRLIMPFIRTSANILNFATDRMPLAILKRKFWEDIQAGGPRANLALAKMALGTLVMLAVGWWWEDGKVTGAAPTDPALRALWNRKKLQPYSIKIGDTWYSYNRWEPIGMILGTAADFFTIVSHSDEWDGAELTSAIMLALANNMTSKTWLRGISELLQAFSDPVRYGNRFVTRFISSAAPAGVAQVSRTVDPVLREVRTIADSLLARLVPGYSKELPPRRDIFGEVRVSDGAFGPDMLSPVYQSIERKDPVVDELLANEIGIRMPSRQIEGVWLSPQEYSRLLELQGKVVKLPGPMSGRPLNLHQSLEELMASPEYKDASGGPDGEKAYLVKSVVHAYRRAAREALKEENPELAETIARTKMEKIVQRSGSKAAAGLGMPIPAQ